MISETVSLLTARSPQVRDLWEAMRGFRMAIIDLQQCNVAVASPEDQTGLLTVGIHRQSVRNYGRTSPSIRLEIQAGAPAIAPSADVQLFDCMDAIGCYISHSRVIQQPPNYGRFIWGNRPIQTWVSHLDYVSRTCGRNTRLPGKWTGRAVLG